MAKISLISWRRREKKFPETEAQRRARAREQSTESDPYCVRTEALDVLTAAPPFELLDFDQKHLMEEMDALALLDSNRFHQAIEEVFDAPGESPVRLDLTADQSRALLAFPLFSGVPAEQVPAGLFQLCKSQDHRGLTLQFSLHAQTIPEMISLKEVCRLLKVGRRTIMRLIRRRELRCYRIAQRYRFAIEDVKHYLDRIATY
jgi:excisionase family DNA binding protein